MMDQTTAIAFVAAFATSVAGGVALFNSHKAVVWKRAELGNSYLKDFTNNSELVFASRCLDWNGGRLVLPEPLQPYIRDGDKTIIHDRFIFEKALSPSLTIREMDDDPRIQIYRASIDSFLSWLSLVSGALDRGLFLTKDVEDVGYWVSKVESELSVMQFVKSYGYETSFLRLATLFRASTTVYSKLYFIPPVVSSRLDLRK